MLCFSEACDIQDLIKIVRPSLREEFRMKCGGKKHVKECRFKLPSQRVLKSKKRKKIFQGKRIVIVS